MTILSVCSATKEGGSERCSTAYNSRKNRVIVMQGKEHFVRCILNVYYIYLLCSYGVQTELFTNKDNWKETKNIIMITKCKTEKSHYGPNTIHHNLFSQVFFISVIVYACH